jgi:hypothetical protein
MPSCAVTPEEQGGGILRWGGMGIGRGRRKSRRAAYARIDPSRSHHMGDACFLV